jgi:hypothetical protein
VREDHLAPGAPDDSRVHFDLHLYRYSRLPP